MLNGRGAPFTTKLIAVVLSVAALALGREFFIPIALALCFQALLTPPVRGLGRLRIPALAGAAIVVLGALAVLVVGAWALSGPASEWVDKAPSNIATARKKLREIGRPLDRLTAAAAGTPADSSPATPPPAAAGGVVRRVGRLPPAPGPESAGGCRDARRLSAGRPVVEREGGRAPVSLPRRGQSALRNAAPRNP